MTIGWVIQFRRIACTAYSRHPVARWCRLWRRLANDPAGETEHSAADILLLPLAGLAASLWVLGSVPGASDAIAMACTTACMP